MKKILLLAYVLIQSVLSFAAVIDNGVVRREVSTSDGHILGTSYVLKATGADFIRNGSEEFSLLINDKRYTGKNTWKDVTVKNVNMPHNGKGIVVSCTAEDGSFSLDINYTTFPNLPLVRKTITITNLGQHDLKVENVDVEHVTLQLDQIESWVMHNYGRQKWFGPYTGDWHDALVIIHDTSKDRGLAVGNETIGVLKRTSVFDDGTSLTIGTTHNTQQFPFRRWLKTGEKWESAPVFTAPYDKERDPQAVVNTTVQTYTRRYMGARIELIAHKPVFVYNTWYPFMRDFDEQKIRDLAKVASECGIEEFVIDDGWQLNIDSPVDNPEYMGDWTIDKKKFPQGLKPVFDYIKSLGMKPGLWISLATADPSSQPYQQHPEWFVQGKDGELVDLHNQTSFSRTACMGTGWYDYIKQNILRLERDYGLAYVKLDLAVLASAYVFDKKRVGCYATTHPGHRDWQGSFDVIYSQIMRLFDELHQEAPNLFIDCTFESAGKLQLMDYGIAKHAEGNWLSNFTQDSPVGNLRVRDLAWGRTPALNPASLVIGNLPMDSDDRELNFKSLTGTLPIMLGDPRKLTTQERARFKQWATWLKSLEARHHFMSFRQDLPGFAAPLEGCWDGFSRINSETKSGGLVGVFRQGAAEASRTVILTGLDPAANYEVRQGCDGKVIATATGIQLMERGFTVRIEKPYDGELFEVIKF